MLFINRKKEQNTVEIVDDTEVEKVEDEVARLRAKYPSRRIVVFAENPTWRGARAAFDAGASDYLPRAKAVGPEREHEESRLIAIRRLGAEAA